MNIWITAVYFSVSILHGINQPFCFAYQKSIPSQFLKQNIKKSAFSFLSKLNKEEAKMGCLLFIIAMCILCPLLSAFLTPIIGIPLAIIISAFFAGGYYDNQ